MHWDLDQCLQFFLNLSTSKTGNICSHMFLKSKYRAFYIPLAGFESLFISSIAALYCFYVVLVLVDILFCVLKLILCSYTFFYCIIYKNETVRVATQDFVSCFIK